MFYPSHIPMILPSQAETKEPPGAASSEASAQRAQQEISLFRQDIERLLMITEALWGILKEKHGYTDEELKRRVADVDLKDGRLDGRVAPTEALDCPHCGYKTSKRRPLCLYCAKPLENDPFAR